MQLYYFLHYLLDTFQMWSDLRILVVGFVSKHNSDVISTLNALVGRQAFSRDRESEKQEACVEVEGGRRLWLTYMPDNLFRDMGNAYSEGRTTELDNTMYHCVVIAMAFDESDLSVWYNPVVSETLSQKFGESFLRKHCVIVVTGGDRFVKARSEGRVTKTFLEWCRSKGGTDTFKPVFHGVQERWLLFNNNGSTDELKHQRGQLVDMIDTQILVGSHYTDLKFTEVNISLRELEKQHLELKGQLEMETKKHLETRESDIQDLKHQITHVKQDTSKLSKKLELQMSKLKRQLLEKTESDTRDLKHHITQVKQDTSKLLETLDQKLATLNEQLTEKEELEERQTAKLDKTERRIRSLAKHLTRLNQLILTKTKGLSQEIEERNADLKERLDEKRESDTQDLKHQIKQVNMESSKRSETLQQQLEELNVKYEEKMSELEKRYKSQLHMATQRTQEATKRSQELEHKVQTATERSQELEHQVTGLKNQLQDITKYKEELHRFYSSKETERSQALERQVAFLGLLRKQLQDKATKLEEQQTFFSSHAIERTKALEQQLTETKEQLEEKTTKLEEQQTSFSDEARERTKTLEQKTTELGKRYRTQLQKATERSQALEYQMVELKQQLHDITTQLSHGVKG